MDAQQWQNVLVLQTSFIGDTVLTLPLICEIKRRFPSARLTLVCTPQGRELLQQHPSIDHILVDDKRGRDRGWRGLWRQAKVLEQQRFTLAISPHKSLRTALLLRLARIPCRIGFDQSKGWFLYSLRVPRNPSAHDVERTLSLLEACGIPLEQCERSFGLQPSAGNQQAVNELFQSAGIDGDRFLVGMNPGSVWATKRWLPEGYARTIELLKQKYHWQVVLFGGPGDVELTRKIQLLSGGAAVDLAGKLSLKELPAALSRLSLFITNDSGPMHMAVAQGVPTIGIFCATTPSLGFYPYSSRAVVLEKALPCRPCSPHGGMRCPLGTEDCMRLITPEHVLQAVEKLLRQAEVSATQGRSVVPEFMTV